MKNLLLVLLTLSFLLPFSAFAQATCEATGSGHCYYMSPTGSDSNDGSFEHPWATLGYVTAYDSDRLHPGDVLYIMGGTYNNIQCWYYGSVAKGTQSDPITIKAYGDSQAIFTVACQGDWSSSYFFNFWKTSWITLDGFGALNNQPYQLKLFNDSKMAAIAINGFSNTSRDQHITVRGVEIDGGTANLSNGIIIQYADYVTIEGNYVHHIGKPTGDIPPGDGTDVWQMSGYGIMVYGGADFGLINRNTVKYCNHGGIELYGDRSTTPNPLTRYYKVTNNIVENHYGGGIYLAFKTMYNLVEGNVVTHAGETTTYPKPGIQINGRYNTVRKNVFFEPQNQGIAIEASYIPGPFYDGSNDNLIYNNIVFGTGIPQNRGGIALVTHDGGYDVSIANNTIANNIFYKSPHINPYNHISSALYIETYWAIESTNWVDPDTYLTPPGTTNWNGNKFYNNLLRKDSDGMSDSSIIEFSGWQGASGGYNLIYSLTQAQNDGSTAWQNNIGDDPMLASEDPDTYGLTNGWWSVPENSFVVNQGVAIDDTNGRYVEENYPGYGWGNLKYSGSLPDIGAFEYGLDDPNGMPCMAGCDDGGNTHVGGGCSICDDQTNPSGDGNTSINVSGGCNISGFDKNFSFVLLILLVSSLV